MFIDFGNQFTSASIWTNRGPIWHKKIKLGGQDITNAISEKFGLSIYDADRIKSAVASMVPTQMDRFTPADTAYDFSRSDVNEIVLPILAKIIEQIKDSCLPHFTKYKPAKIVLTGGGTAGHVTPNIALIPFLKENGYKVVCIDKERVYGWGVCYNHIPWGVEDYTGNLPLQERIDIIKDADFFIGLPSGLTWLAWCCKVPIVLISGFSLPKTEFYTPYRIINYNACCGCWDDVTKNFEHDNYMWCPYKESDDEKFECTKLITPDHVINVIKTIPTFKKGDKN
jgi:hypothetical protein